MYLRVVPHITRRLIVAELTLVSLGAVTVERPECVDTLSSVSALVLVALIHILITSAEAWTDRLLCMGVVNLICMEYKENKSIEKESKNIIQVALNELSSWIHSYSHLHGSDSTAVPTEHSKRNFSSQVLSACHFKHGVLL